MIPLLYFIFKYKILYEKSEYFRAIFIDKTEIILYNLSEWIFVQKRDVMTRRESRICAFELLFETDFHKDSDYETVMKNAVEIREIKPSGFASELYTLCSENLEEIDAHIGSASDKWKVSRMNKVIRAILRLALGEMLYTDTPAKAAINEAVEIAKVYGDEKAPAFVNGVLNKLARELGKIADESAEQ